MTQHPTSPELPEPASFPTADSMPDVSQLRKEHAELADVAGRLRKIVARDVPPDAGKLYELRMSLTSLLIRHLKTEDWLLYPRLLHSGNDRAVVTARAFAASMGELASDFHDYVGRWGATAIGKNWTGYQRETSEILRVLALRIAREDRDLFPHVEQAERKQH
jgi:hypothetical protein